LSGSYFGRGLSVDLTSQSIDKFSIDDSLFKEYLGGYGLAVRLILERQPVNINPLEEQSIIAFAPGLLTGTGAPFSGRFSISGKSPLTSSWGDSNAGGYFGPVFRKCGYDILLISGISEKPVFLNITEKKSELIDASHIWGKNTVESERLLKKELVEENVQIACIGKAGEKISLISCIITDGGRAAGRSGLGAIMGRKRIKAITVNGSKTVSLADGNLFERVSQDINLLFQTSKFSKIESKSYKFLIPLFSKLFGSKILSISGNQGKRSLIKMFKKYGTSMYVSTQISSGDSPTKNWTGVTDRDFPNEQSKRISDDSVIKYQKDRYACSSCPMGCGGLVDVENNSEYDCKNVHRPEYETLISFGSLLLNDNVESIIKATDICNQYGLDTISSGAVIGFAIECFEKGLIDLDDVGGTPLKWGDSYSIISLLKKIGDRDGFGSVLADGVKRASEVISNGSERYAVNVGGQEPPMHDPRVTPSMGTTYVVDPAPGRHTPGGASLAESLNVRFPLKSIILPKISRYQYTGKGQVHKAYTCFNHTVNSLGLCTFGTTGPTGLMNVLDITNAATGWNLDDNDLLMIGERILTARHLFNLTEGIEPRDFILPNRLKGIPPLDSGPTSGITIDIDSLVKDFYSAMDWNSNTAWPNPDKLDILGLKDLVENRI
jgi:aldehyde:ferredoxin oxidoreductase